MSDTCLVGAEVALGETPVYDATEQVQSVSGLSINGLEFKKMRIIITLGAKSMVSVMPNSTQCWQTI